MASVHPKVIRWRSIRSLMIQSIISAWMICYYHGHRLSVVYDKDGKKYGLGKGVIVFVDGKKVKPSEAKGKWQVNIGNSEPLVSKKDPLNVALNINYKGYPVPSSSINAIPDSLFQAIDGRTWYFPEISNRWSTLGSTSDSDWYAVDFGAPKNISTIKVALFADGKTFGAPEQIQFEYNDGGKWRPLQAERQVPEKTHC